MKRISIFLTVFSLVVALVSIAAAPMAAGTATLIGAGYVEGKGVVFTFHIDGKVSKSDLKGSVHVNGGGDYGLDCVQQDAETVKCTAPKAVAGNDVSVTWGGSTFWTYVAGIPAPAENTQYCYGVWDYWSFTGWEWVDFGPHCQDQEAQNGDVLTYSVPDPSGSFEADVVFFEDPSVCSNLPQQGSAYYYDECGD